MHDFQNEYPKTNPYHVYITSNKTTRIEIKPSDSIITHDTVLFVVALPLLNFLYRVSGIRNYAAVSQFDYSDFMR